MLGWVQQGRRVLQNELLIFAHVLLTYQRQMQLHGFLNYRREVRSIRGGRTSLSR